MSDRKFELKNNEGTMWTSNLEILGRGTIKRNNKDQFVALVSHKNKEGKLIYEMMQSCGVIYFNAPEEKRGDSSPDFSGKIALNGSVRASMWENVSDRGTKYFNVKLKDTEETDPPF